MASEARASRDYREARGSRFRFKQRQPSKRTHNGRNNNDTIHKLRKRCRRSPELPPHEFSQHTNHKGTYREQQPLDGAPALNEETLANTAQPEEFADVDTAFQESLFDALADDEGASFWEGVYGQPIHVYSNLKPNSDADAEQMNDEEYAEYVRRRMWEKTHQHVIEEREKREAQRRRRKQQEEQTWNDGEAQKRRSYRENEDLNVKILDSLRRGEEQSIRKRWQDPWIRYLSAWEDFKKRLEACEDTEGSLGTQDARDMIPWPTKSRSWKRMQRDEIADFFQNSVPPTTDISTVLKAERVRWHPDKMQQRFGAARLDDETIRMITSVFQSIDDLWTKHKSRRSGTKA